MEDNGMEEVIFLIFQNDKNSRRTNTICCFSLLFMDEQILQKRRAPISKQEGWRSRALFSKIVLLAQ
jgi:hypothetical protein